MTPSALINLWPSLRTVLDQPARPRNGKIARLPEPDRIAINQMLDQGLPYHTILERLGDAGRQLNPQNLSNWKHLGGYQSWRTRKLRALIFNTVLHPETEPPPSLPLTSDPSPAPGGQPEMNQPDSREIPLPSTSFHITPAQQTLNHLELP